MDVVESEVFWRSQAQVHAIGQFRTGLANFYNRSFWQTLPEDSEVFSGQFPDGDKDKAQRITAVRKSKDLECMASLPTERSNHNRQFFGDRTSPNVRMTGRGDLLILNSLAETVLKDLQRIAKNPKSTLNFLAVTMGVSEALIANKYLNYSLIIRKERGVSEIFLEFSGYSNDGTVIEGKSPFSPDGEEGFRYVKVRLGKCGPNSLVPRVYLGVGEAESYFENDTSADLSCKMTVGSLGIAHGDPLSLLFDRISQVQSLEH